MKHKQRLGLSLTLAALGLGLAFFVPRIDRPGPQPEAGTASAPVAAKAAVPARSAAELSAVQAGAGASPARTVVGSSTPAPDADLGASSLSLLPEVLFEGRVEDSAGQAVPGADVTVRFQTWNRFRTTAATSDANGTFAVALDAHAQPQLEVLVRTRSSGRALIRASLEEPDRCLIVLAPVAPFELRLMDSTGHSFPGARVELDLPRESFADWHGGDALDRRIGYTAPDGSLQFSGLPIGGAELRIVAADHGELTRHVRVQAGAAPLELRLTASIRTTLILLDERGVPVPGARVHWRGKWAGAPDAATGLADERGELQLEAAESGDYELAVEPPPTRADLAPLRVVQALVSGERATLGLTRGASLEGRLDPAAPRPAQVRLENEAGHVVALEIVRGETYRITKQPAGSYHLLASANNGWSSEPLALSLQAGEHRVLDEIAYRQGARVRGFVFSDAGQLGGTSVFLSPLTESSELPHLSSTTDAFGQFEIGGVAPGSYSLTVAPHQAAHKRIAPIEVSADADIDLGSLHVASGSILSVRVLDAEGGPVPGLEVSLSPKGAGSRSARTDASGEARFVGLAAGEALVSTSAGAGRTGELTYLAPEGEQQLDLWLSEPLKWSTVLTRAGGRPAAGFGTRLVAVDRTWSTGAAVVDAQGRVTWIGVGAGAVRLEAHGGAARTEPLVLRLSAAELAERPDRLELPEGELPAE